MKTRFLLALCTLLLTGCQSRFVTLNIQNQGKDRLTDIEVDYPSGPPSDGSESFGVDHLDAGKEYRYKFKPAGTGSVRLRFLDAAGKKHTEDGPSLHPGVRGQITVSLDAAGENKWIQELAGK